MSLLFLIVLAGAPAAFATFVPETISAGGGTFVNPVMQVWTQGFGGFTSGAVNINYAAVGSGAGITGILAQTYAYAGSDAPVDSSKWSTASCEPGCGTLLQFPETLGGVAIFYNIPGVTQNLNLTGPIIADIYLQVITNWNDPAITAINPGINPGLLNHIIIPVHRFDGSGTTYALTTYFTRASADWVSSGIGYGTTVSWPNSPNPELAATGSGGVAADVKGNSYSIGYADSYYALSNKLVSAYVLNSAGVYQLPTLASIAAAAQADASLVQANPTYSITNAPGATSYPIATFTYLLIWENQGNQGIGNDLAQFFWWVVTTGQADGPALNYPALPGNVVTIDENIITQMNYQGTPFIVITTATVNCTPSSVRVGLNTKCTVTVSGGSKGGVVAWANTGVGQFPKPTCILNRALQCKTTFKTGEAITTDIVVSYLGNGGAGGFNGQFSLTVTPTTSKVSFACHPSRIAVGASTNCKAIVYGYYPTGTVTFSQSGVGTLLSGGTCTLSSPTKTRSSCTLALQGATSGIDQITAAYGGDTNNAASTSKTHNLTIQ